MKKIIYNYLLVTTSLAGLLSGCIATQQQKVAENIRALNAARSTQVLAGVEAQEVSVAINNPSNNETANATVLMGEMTLSQCVKLALTHSIELFKQELELDKASADVNRAFYSVFPKLNLSGDVNTLTPFDDPDKESYDLKLTLTQPLWQGGAISAAYRYANYEYEKARLSVWEKKEDLLYQISSLYSEIILKQELVAVYQSAVDVSERLLSTSKNKLEGGVASRYEVLRAEVEVANARAELIREENELSELKLKLYNVMGVSQASDVKLVDELVLDESKIDTSNANSLALNNRAELLSAMCDIKKAEETLTIVKAEYRPHIDLYASGAYGNSRGEESDWEDEWQAGIKASMPIFDGFSRSYKLLSAKAELRQAEAELRLKEKNILTEAANAIMQLAYAERYYESQKKNKELSEEVLRMVEAGFKVGKNTQIEVLDARAALTEAMGGYYKSIYTIKQARLDYNLAIGNMNANALGLEEGAKLEQ
jgi:outer membrane protein TolC